MNVLAFCFVGICLFCEDLSACVSVYHMYVWFLLRSEEVVGSPGTEVIDSVICRMGYGLWVMVIGCSWVLWKSTECS